MKFICSLLSLVACTFITGTNTECLRDKVDRLSGLLRQVIRRQTSLEAKVEALESAAAAAASAQCEDYALLNPSFETTDQDWQSYNGGFTYTTSTASDGVQSIAIQNGGAYQVIRPPAGTRYLQVTADSWSEGVTAPDSNDYSIYCDIKLADNSWLYGESVRFEVAQTSWHTRTLSVSATQDIQEGWCYAMFRNSLSGTAYFYYFRVKYAPDSSQCPE